jgi:hypothetical protein
MIKKSALYFLTISLLFSACKKKYLDAVPVIEILQDISIPNANSIKHFVFTNDQIGYASDSTSIYKTINGGSTWTKLTLPTLGAVCSGLEFFDSLRGMTILNQMLYTTIDGGETWNTNANSADFIGISESGVGIYLRDNGMDCSVFKTTNKGSSFSFLGTISLDGSYSNAALSDNRVMAWSDEVGDNDRAYGIDLTNNTNFFIAFGNLIYLDQINSIYLSDGGGAAAGIRGNIREVDGNLAVSRNAYNHTYPYYCIDGYNDLIVAVGYHTITTNMILTENQEKAWSEVFDSNGNGFDQTFYKIKFINSTSFYLSGSKGLLWKVRI